MVLPPNLPRLRVGFILAHRFTLCAFANFVDVLRLAADEGDRSRPIHCSWTVIGAVMHPVRSSAGLAVQPDERLGDPARFDYVVVVGGLIDEIERLHPDCVSFLRRAAAAGVPLVGLCTGAFILHRAGLMEGYRCCVSWFHHQDFLEQFEGLRPVADRIFVVDRDRLTCSGGASSAYLAAFLADRHVGPAAAKKSLRIMIIDDEPAGGMPQPGAPVGFSSGDALVRKALNIMQQTLDTPPSMEALARRLDVSRRKLERRFTRSLGLSPSAAARAIRIDHARFLLECDGRSVAQIAADTGFCDASHLTRVFREREGLSPDAYRRRARAGTAMRQG